MFQLCIGHVTFLPCTMPCDKGPPLCGQRLLSANTWSSTLRNRAISPEAVLATYKRVTGQEPPEAWVFCVRGESFELGAFKLKEHELGIFDHRQMIPEAKEDLSLVSARVRGALKKFINKRRERRPMILPVIMEI